MYVGIYIYIYMNVCVCVYACMNGCMSGGCMSEVWLSPDEMLGPKRPQTLVWFGRV